MRSGALSHALYYGGLSYDTPLSIFGASRIKLDLNGDLGITFGIGSNVASWADQSAFGNSPAQATTATQPTQVLSVLDGHAAVRCNGSQWLGVLTMNGVAAGDLPRIYSVMSWALAQGSGQQGTSIQIASSATLNQNGMYLTRATTGVYCVPFRNALIVAGGVTSLGTSGVPILLDGRNDTAASVVAVNGTDVASTAASGGLNTTPDRLYVGVKTDLSAMLTGDMFRHLIINPPPTAAEHTRLLAYFKRTYPSLALP